MRNEMALVYDRQINVADLFSARADGLDARKGYRLLQVLAPKAGGKDAQRRSRPMLNHLLGVLFDNLLDVRKLDDARLWVRLQSLFEKRGDDMALA